MKRQQFSSNIVISNERLKEAIKILRVGDLILVNIIDVIDDNRYLIKIQGIKLTASVNALLEAGTYLYAEVVSLVPRIQLKLKQRTATITERFNYLRKKVREAGDVISLRPLLGDILRDFYKDFRGLAKTLDLLQQKNVLKDAQEVESLLVKYSENNDYLKIFFENIGSTEDLVKFADSFMIKCSLMADEIKKYDTQRFSSVLKRILKHAENLLLNICLYDDINRTQAKSRCLQFPFYTDCSFATAEIFLVRQNPEFFQGKFFFHVEILLSADFLFNHEKKEIIFGECSDSDTMMMRIFEFFKVNLSDTGIEVKKDKMFFKSADFGLNIEPTCVNMNHRNNITFVA